MFVYSEYEGPVKVAMTVDGAPPGPLGRLFIVPSKEVVEVPDIAGRALIEHLAYLGVVKVDTIKTRAGLEFDIKKAEGESATLLETSDRIRFQEFVMSTIQDQVSRGKVVPPPSAGILDIMTRRGYKLDDYGIKPMGTEEAKRAVESNHAEVAALKVEIDSLRDMIRGMAGQPIDSRVSVDGPESESEEEEQQQQTPKKSRRN